jgi:predicted DNA binding CopG/RHH family protein
MKKMKTKKNNKNYKLTSEELALEKEIESGDWIDAPLSLKQEMVEVAKNGVARKKREARINIRMTSETLELIQNLALQEGVGYQTLIGSVIHKYAHGLFVATDDVKKILSSLGLNKRILNK